MSGAAVPPPRTLAPPALIRVLSARDMTAVGINGVIGAGIFVVPAALVRSLGASSTFVYLLASALITLVALCFAEVGSRFDRAGGPFLYARAAFGAFVGFEVAWFTWLARLTSLAALANGFVLYAAYLRPGLDSGWPRALALCLLLGGLTVVNLIGVRQGSRTVNLLTVCKLAPLALFVLVGAAFVDPAALRPAGWPPLSEVTRSTLLLLYVFGGFEVLTFPAEEVADPRRSIPRAVLTTQIVVLIFYVSVHAVTLGTLPDIASSLTPVAAAAGRFMGETGGVLIALGAVLSIAGCQSGIMLTTPRLLFAVARDGRLPAALTRVHPRFLTPHWAILVQGAAGLVMALWGTFEGMALLSVIARLVSYVSTCLAALALRRRSGPAPFSLPAGPLIPLAAAGLCVWLAAGSEAGTLAWGAAAALLGAALFLATRLLPPPLPG
jgi:amino acid transporter